MAACTKKPNQYSIWEKGRCYTGGMWEGAVSTAVRIALAKVSSLSFTVKRALRTASLLTKHMKCVCIASSRGSLMEGKSHVTASCRILAASLSIVSPGLHCISNQKLKRSLTMHLAGSNWFFMKSVNSSIVSSLISFGGDCCEARLHSKLYVTFDWLVRKICADLSSSTEFAPNESVEQCQIIGP